MSPHARDGATIVAFSGLRRFVATFCGGDVCDLATTFSVAVLHLYFF
jgi:hypothetical protein